MELAESMEAEHPPQLEGALENYSKAKDFFDAEDQKSQTIKAQLKMARIYGEVNITTICASERHASETRRSLLFSPCRTESALFACPLHLQLLNRRPLQIDPPQYDKAVECFEEVAAEQLKSNLLKFQAKNQYFDAILCTLAGEDIVAAERRLQQYADLDYTFPGVREHKLCTDIIEAYKASDLKAFLESIMNYDTISKLEPWRTRCENNLHHVRISFCFVDVLLTRARRLHAPAFWCLS